jgi:hypothetical protein
MKALENRTVDSKREMDILDALQDIRARNARHERAGQGEIVDKVTVEDEETEEDLQKRLEDEEDERLVRQVFSKVDLPSAPISSRAPLTVDSPPVDDTSSPTAAKTQVTVKRKAEGAEPDLHALLPEATRVLISSKASLMPSTKKPKLTGKSALGIKVMKGKTKLAAT